MGRKSLLTKLLFCLFLCFYRLNNMKKQVDGYTEY